MATRRNITDDKADRIISPAPAAKTSDISPAVPTSTILKLLATTILMVTLPISAYFITARTIFRGNSTWAGATAALVANLVLIGYIVVAVREDQGDRRAEEERGKGKKGD